MCWPPTASSTASRIAATGALTITQPATSATPLTQLAVRLRATDTDATGNGTIDDVTINAVGGILAVANDGFNNGDMTSSADSVAVIATTGDIDGLDITSEGADSVSKMEATTGSILTGSVTGSNDIDVDASVNIVGLNTFSVDDAKIDAGNDILDSVFSASSLNPAEGVIRIRNFNTYASNTASSTGDISLDGPIFVSGNTFRSDRDVFIGTDVSLATPLPADAATGLRVGFVTGNEIDSDRDVIILADGDINGGTINASGDVTLETTAGLAGNITGISITSVGGLGTIDVDADGSITGNEVSGDGVVTFDATTGDIAGGTIDAAGAVTLTVPVGTNGDIDGILISSDDVVTINALGVGTSDIRNVAATGTVVDFNSSSNIFTSTATSTTGAVTANALAAGSGDISGLIVNAFHHRFG